jgi:thioesterase domain-containing protein
VEAADLRSWLRDRLPDYMVPSAFVPLDKLPLSPNGKLDRKALPVPNDDELSVDPRVHVAPRNPLERQLVDMWEEMLGIKPIGVTDNFFDLGGHSLVAVRMISMLSKQSERDIPVAALFESPTIETLARILSEPDTAHANSPLVPIQSRGNRSPLFCVHALFGSVLCFVELARALGTDQPLFGLQSVGLQGDDEPLADIEPMAAAYIAAMRSRRPHGPYRLGGYSMGGVIAYEMARQLREQGESTELLVLFDTYTPAAAGLDHVRGMSESELLAWFLEDQTGWVTQHNPEMARTLATLSPDERIAHLLAELQSTGHVPPHIGPDKIDRYLRVLNGNLQAFHRYQMKPYDGAVLFVRSTGGTGDDRDPLPDWTNLCTGRFDVIRVPGFHGTMLSQPHVAHAAAQLARWL